MQDLNLLDVLKEIGLSDKEAQVYLTLLELNESLPSTISRKSGIKRPTVYVILEQLKERGIVSHFKKGKLLFYRAADPHAILDDQTRKLEDFKGVLPDLMNLKTRFGATPQMSIFEGKEGIIQVMEDSLTAQSGEILCWSNADLAVNTLLKDYHPNYLRNKVEKGIWTKCLFVLDEVGVGFKSRSKEELREVFFIPKDKFPFDNEINIYDDKMSIISHVDNVGVIIQNQAIANTQKSIFNFAFEYAKLIEKDLMCEYSKVLKRI